MNREIIITLVFNGFDFKNMTTVMQEDCTAEFLINYFTTNFANKIYSKFQITWDQEGQYPVLEKVPLIKQEIKNRSKLFCWRELPPQIIIKQQECFLCKTEILGKFKNLPCYHRFHVFCIENQENSNQKNYCPICEKNKKIQFPPEWIDQGDQNFVKILLQNTDSEYISVKAEFDKTLKSKQIRAIYRIQNKELYNNYFYEKQKMINRNAQRGINLEENEKERFLWHGVRGQHPSVIYQGNREAFDVTYSNKGMWGVGVYYAEKASYSDDYSYQIKNTDNSQYVGSNVFLCCKVSLGKCYNTNPDNNIKRPPAIENLQNEYYDSVSGVTNGSNVFILYSMDARRAYPAYEVIYQK